MKLKRFIFIFSLLLFLANANSYARQTPDLKRLQDWNAHCDRLKGIPSGKENYPELIKAAKAGIKMTPSGNYLYQSIFNFHLAGGYESTYQMDSAIRYYEISRKFGMLAKNNSRIVYALRRLAGLYDGKQMRGEADHVRNQLTEIAKVDQDEEIQVGANIVLGEYYFNAGLFEKALKCYLDYIKYLKIDYAKSRNSGSRSNIGVGYLAIGEIYQNLNRPSESLDYFNESIGYLGNYREGLETAYKDLVTSYLSLKQLKEAHQTYHKLEKSVAISQDFTILIDAQIALGCALMQEGDLNSADRMLAQAGKNIGLNKDQEDLYLYQFAMGDLNLKQNKPDEAIRYYKEALPNAVYFKNKASIAAIYYNLAEAERMVHHEVDAYKHILQYARYTDSLKAESISKNIIEMEARFQNEVKADKIKVLNQENTIKNIQLRQEKRIRWLFVGASIVSLLALILIFVNYRNKRKANVALDRKNQELDRINEKLNVANQTKSKLFGMISHDLRGPVGQLFTFLKLQQHHSTGFTDAERERHQQDLVKSSSNLLETMEDLLLWSKSQMENFEPEFENLELEEVFTRAINVLENQARFKQVDIEVGTLRFTDLVTDYNLVLVILRNLIQNAIQHSNPGDVVVLGTDFTEHAEKCITVLNSGEAIGADQITTLLSSKVVKSKSTGYGLVMVQEMSERIFARLDISSSTEAGTEVRLIFNSRESA